MNEPSSPATCEAAEATGDAVERRVEEVFQSAHHELLGTLYYLVGNLEDARDALQETFIKCWQNCHRAEIRDVKAWVFKIALNTGRDLCRTAWTRRRRPLGEELAAMMMSTDPGPEAVVLQREQLELLRQAILRLRPEEQEVFLLRQNGALTYEQIARTKEVPLATIKARMRAAIHKLHAALGKRTEEER
jgi:RNA polymerase sigma factor (sigma-70 family)